MEYDTEVCRKQEVILKLQLHVTKMLQKHVDIEAVKTDEIYTIISYGNFTQHSACTHTRTRTLTHAFTEPILSHKLFIISALSM